MEKTNHQEKRLIPSAPGHASYLEMLTVDVPQTIDYVILSRYPALTEFASQLSEHATIFIDDAKRIMEQEMIGKWLQQYPGWKSRMIDTIPVTCFLER